MFNLKNAAAGISVAAMLASGVALAQMGQPGAMGAQMPMMGMGDHKPMMGQSNMMGQMSMMGMSHQGGMGMPFEHVEGRIAFLRAELNIEDSQVAPWNAFADVLRSNAKSMKDMHEEMMSQSNAMALPQRVDMHEKIMTAHLEMHRKFQAATKPLYDALNDQQKKMADNLIKWMCGI